MDLDRVYQARFPSHSEAGKDGIWGEVCGYLQRYVDPDAPVLDVATDRGYFIRNITARERWAVDVRDVKSGLPEDVRFVQVSGLEMASSLPAAHFGTVFMSNYLEHLPDSTAVVEQLRQAFTVLRPNGRLVILQPNLRLVGAAYWDFIDHHTALTEVSLVEAAELAGFHTRHVIKRFLPYTTRSRLPQTPRLVGLYLRCRPAWWLLGKQTLYVGERTP